MIGVRAALVAVARAAVGLTVADKVESAEVAEEVAPDAESGAESGRERFIGGVPQVSSSSDKSLMVKSEYAGLLNANAKHRSGAEEEEEEGDGADEGGGSADGDEEEEDADIEP
jgi:hypothetical protein